MSLNINLTSPTTPNSLSNYGNHASLENSFNTLRQKSFINEGSGSYSSEMFRSSRLCFPAVLFLRADLRLRVSLALVAFF